VDPHDIRIEVIDGKGGSRTLNDFEREALTADLELNKTRVLLWLAKNLKILSILRMAKAKIRLTLGMGAYANAAERSMIPKDILGGIDVRFVRIRLAEHDLVFENHTGLMGVIGDIIIRNQYSATKENIRGKVVIDAGANRGMFSLCAAALGAKKVYAFEPVSKTFMKLRQNVIRNGFEGIIIPVNAALGEETGKSTIFYHGENEGAAASLVFKEKRENSEDIDITTIDSFMAGKKESVGFIKIDTEGYERQVLAGARKTIIKNKPALSFSAYHFKEDVTELPKVVNGIRSDYTSALKKLGEADFYCE
jgi:FkbM family methyltransferase